MFKKKSNQFKWILYDWANSVFATTVVAALFPIMLKKYWGSSLSFPQSTYYLGLTNSLTAFLIFFLTIIIGYLLDHKIKAPQKTLFCLAALGSFFSILLSLIPAGSYILALLVFSLAFIFFATGNTVYDSLLLKISKENTKSIDNLSLQRSLEKISSYGYFSGYLGGGILLLLQALLIILYKNFGLLSSAQAVKISFFSVGVWWIIFSLPLLSIKLKKENNDEEEETNKKNLKLTKAISLFYSKLSTKAKWFILAYFLYIDVVFTTYKMAVDFGLSVGLSQEYLIAILIYVQFIGAPGTLLIQYISNKKSVFFALLVGLSCYAIALSFSPFVKTIPSFVFLATLVGLGQGGVQSLSRGYFASITPKDMQGMSFGFLNLIGKASAVLGPLIIGLTAYLMGSNTYSIISLLPVLALGVYVLFKSHDLA